MASDSDLIISRSIADADGPKVANSFYGNLFKGHGSTTTDISGPDTTQAARALHVAVAKLRSENASFVRWVPFVYLGKLSLISVLFPIESLVITCNMTTADWYAHVSYVSQKSPQITSLLVCVTRPHML